MDADALYRLAPEHFTAARDTAAKQLRADGDRDGAAALAALRRPSVAAWLVNRLAQDEARLLGQLLDLGPGLAQAQAGQDAAALRALGAQRTALVEAVTTRAVEVAGRPVTAAVRAEVHTTLDAALADPASAAAVRSGRLVRALSYAGFGEVDLADAVAPAAGAAEQAPAKAPRQDRGARRSKERDRERDRERERAGQLAEAVAAAEEASGRLDDAVRACERAERAREQAEQEAQERAAEVERRAAALAGAEREAAAAGTAVERAADAGAQALEAVRSAQDHAEQARARVDRLRREQDGRVSGR